MRKNLKKYNLFGLAADIQVGNMQCSSSKHYCF